MSIERRLWNVAHTYGSYKSCNSISLLTGDWLENTAVPLV